MSDPSESARNDRDRLVPAWWLLVTGAAAFGIAVWLRSLSTTVLISSLAAAILGAFAVRRARAGIAGWLATAVLVVTLGVALIYQRRLGLIETSWDRYAASVADEGTRILQEAVRREVEILDTVANDALSAPREASAAFDYLEKLGPFSTHRGVVLSDRQGPVAWAGTLRSPEAQPGDSSGIQWTPFYIVVRRIAKRDGRIATADAVLHAEPPADRIAGSVDAWLRRAPELAGFAYRDTATASGDWRLILVGTQFLAVRPHLLSQGEATQRISETARRWGGIGLLVVACILVGIAWRRPAGLGRRVSVLIALLGLVALLPFSAYSNQSLIFDPGVYYAPILGPMSGSIAALSATSALVLLGFFALGRAGVRLRGVWLPAVAILVMASLGPFLLRELARGIALPGRGASIQLWLSWQVPLFLAAAAILLAGASAGRMLLGRWRGVTPWAAPVLAALASLIAPLLWLAPGRLPSWYVGLWIIAMTALALSRRSRALVASVGVVAACGATTLTWYAVSRARVQLAESEVARLSTPDPGTRELTERLAEIVRTGEPPLERSELLKRFVESPLAAAGNPVELSSWRPGDLRPYAELRIREFASHVEGEWDLVMQARESSTRQAIWHESESPQGRQTQAAIPHPDGSVTTIVVAPQSRLVEEDPFSVLAGLSRPNTAEPPYDLVLTAVPSQVALSERPTWERKGNELHGDWLVPGAGEGARAHVEVELRGLDVLAPRGALIVLLDIVILGVLWTIVAMSDVGFVRWARGRLGGWFRSYRGRLTVTLFAFFMIPAVAFAVWSYSRLIQSDRESRVLLLRETLRVVTSLSASEDLAGVGERFDTPLLAYRGGQLVRASDSLYTQLAPVGRYLPADVEIGTGVEGEVTMTSRPVVAGVPLLLGYRPFAGGGRAVLAASAPLTERVLDRERRDIGVLVLFAASIGALAALALSGLAARELERPVGALRLAALRIARGERYPAPKDAPVKEFVPVFSAFERMDADLAASRTALEEAQRRTESVLRDVASGVIAVDRDGRVMIANPGADALLGRPVTPGLTLRQLGQPGLTVRTEAFLNGTNSDDAFDETINGRQVRGSLAHLERGTGGAVITLEDVTELARAQRVLAWGEMARQVAHEIKNPLTPIRLGVQHLRRARGDNRVDFGRIFEQNVERILAEIDRLDEIARAFSRYGMSPTERLEPVPLDVSAITRDVVDLERMAADGVTWHLASPAAPAMALARDDELREVLLNVMENARQAGASRIDVSVLPGTERVEVTVRDDGDGVSPEDLDRIFEPRFSTRTSGSGLGLAISRNMVEGWGGRMYAERATDRGTVMHISLAASDTR